MAKFDTASLTLAGVDALISFFFFFFLFLFSFFSSPHSGFYLPSVTCTLSEGVIAVTT